MCVLVFLFNSSYPFIVILLVFSYNLEIPILIGINKQTIIVNFHDILLSIHNVAIT